MDSFRISTIFYQELSVFMPMRRRCARGSRQFPLDREGLFNFLQVRLRFMFDSYAELPVEPAKIDAIAVGLIEASLAEAGGFPS